jgi:hypothetical protein
MAKVTIKPNPKTNEVLNDLAKYLDFCRDYGYRYNEADLYNTKSYPYQQFQKLLAGKRPKDMWLTDGRRFGSFEA